MGQLHNAAVASASISLTNHGRARFAEATQRIYGAPPAEWNGEWTLVILPRSLQRRRDDLREELTLARLRPDHAAASSRIRRIAKTPCARGSRS